MQEEIREIEQRRLTALVSGDLETADALHADDFQLITPQGEAMSKRSYLDAIRTGMLRYDVWQPGEIEVRLNGDGAVIRYQAKLGNTWAGQSYPPRDFWHTDYYEKRDGSWRVVWSQATEVR
ncbi:MAG TPA: nuclear transport factor 2 family protein [Caulobacteraceae bacterium]|jgi:hypothetical protein